MTTDPTETARLHDEILTGRAESATLRGLLSAENERANKAIDRETTAEEAEEEQRLALSQALGLGTGAPWDAIHARAVELAAAGPAPAPDQAAPVCKFDEGCHRVQACDPGCGAVSSAATGQAAFAVNPNAPSLEFQCTPTERAAFVPPSAEGLPPGVLDSATSGASALDAWARDPRGRNFLAHALVQLARDGWLRTEPGAGFETVREREAAEPQDPDALPTPGGQTAEIEEPR